MTDPTPNGPVSSNRGVMIVLSYLGPLALVPLLVETEDKDVQWHAKNGIVFMVVDIVFWFIATIVVWALSFGFGCVIWPLIALLILAVHIIAIVKGLNGQRLMIPVVSDYASKF